MLSQDLNPGFTAKRERAGNELICGGAHGVNVNGRGGIGSGSSLNELGRDIGRCSREASHLIVHFHVANLALYHQLLESNGFESVSSHDATAWYKVQAANELEQMRGPLYQAAKELADEQVINNLILEWEALVDSIAIGALSQGYFRGRKPG